MGACGIYGEKRNTSGMQDKPEGKIPLIRLKRR
jgi:hypothetical protein